jgi:hypothetical protein
MSDNKRNPNESSGGVSFSLSGPALASCLSLLVILILVLALVSGCIPLQASIRNNDDDGSVCVKWERISDLFTGKDSGSGDTDTDSLSPP